MADAPPVSGGPNPSGLCRCGCGQTTPRTNWPGNGYLPGQHLSFLRGHQRTLDLTGRVFGWLTALHRAPYHPARGTRWVCRCDYGSLRCLGYVTIPSGNLLTGNSKRCTPCGDEAATAARRHLGPCDYCGLPRRPYRRWEDMILCNRCYQRARARGSGPTYLTCSRCGRRGIDEAKTSGLCWYCEQQVASGTGKNNRYYFSTKWLLSDLDANVGQWYVLPCISWVDPHGDDCWVWLGGVRHTGAPTFRGRSLNGLIYRRYVNPTHTGRVYGCTKHAGCINLAHLSPTWRVTDDWLRYLERQRRSCWVPRAA